MRAVLYREEDGSLVALGCGMSHMKSKYRLIFQKPGCKKKKTHDLTSKAQVPLQYFRL